ncbi:hypothetical protein [Candidatus Regiella endosymbiont of Tuberolachnus salignus]|uniref:hypothetical protein n=1 Tax=Candidatus Regiella endosymbiont of Tuberolachnus salignus TaxID=3077956 RepID=UPI0030D48338
MELSLRFDASVLVQYRDDNIAHKGQHARSSDELTGIRAYDYACADLYNQVEIERTKTLMASEQPFINVFFLTEEIYQSRLSGVMRDYSLLINRPCYDQQYIIQLYANPAALAAANFLYQQNPLLSIWYRYDPLKQQLAKVAGTEYLGDHRKKRIILVDNRMENNSGESSIDGEIIANLLLHKPLFINQPLLRSHDIITQLSLMATGFSTVEFTETVKFLEEDIKQPGEIFQLPRFIVDFCAVLTEKEVEIKRTIIQEKLITVDTIGLKWTGTATSSGMTWNLTQPGDKKIIISNNQEDDQKTLLSHPLEKYLIDPNKIVTAFQPEPFTLGYITKTPIINQKKLSACWIHEDTAQALLHSGQQGALLMSADSMVLLVAMGGGGGEIIIFDRQLAKIALLMEALASSLLKKNYTDWFDSLNLSNGKLALKSLINKLFHAPQIAFERLQSRVRHNQFTFYHIDLAKNRNTQDINKILQKMYSKSDIIAAVYLGNIDDYIFLNRQEITKNSTGLNITTISSTIYDINNFLKLLPKNISIYYHSFYLIDYNTQNFSTKINRLQDNYSKIKYIERIKQSKSGYIINNIYPYILSFAAKKIKMAGILGDEWIAILSDIRYYPQEKKYRIPYLNINDFIEIKTLETTNKFFTDINPLLDKSTATIREFCRFGNGQLPIKHLSKIIDINNIGNKADFTASVYKFWSDMDIGINNISPIFIDLRKALDIYFALSVPIDINNVSNTSDTATDIQLTLFREGKLSQIPARMKSVNRFFNMMDRTSNKKTEVIASGLARKNFVLNTDELIATKEQEKHHSAMTQITDNVMNTAFSIAGNIATVMLSITNIMLTALSRFIPHKTENSLKNRENIHTWGHYFNRMNEGWQQGGFSLEQGVLLPVEGVVIRRIDLRRRNNPTVLFDRHGQQIRKMEKAGIPTDLDTYINLHKLTGIEEEKTITVLQDNPNLNRFVLPVTPRASMEPIYDSVLFPVLQTLPEFKTLRQFAQKDPGFIFAEQIKTSASITSVWRVITKIIFNYSWTTIDILLGNGDYKLIAPGVSEDQQVEHSLYKGYLYYTLFAPETGDAVVVLGLNKAQADLRIKCSNNKVKWVISASHLSGMQVTLTDSVLNFQRHSPDKKTETIKITITDIKNTQLIIQLATGLLEIDKQNLSIIPLQVNVQTLLDNRIIANKNQRTVKKYLAEYTKGLKEVIKLLRINNFHPIEEEQSQACFYSLRQNDFIYTKTDDNTLFTHKTKRTHVELLFTNEKYAWYKGNVSVIIPHEIDHNQPADQTTKANIYTYHNICWVSDFYTKELIKIYLPINHKMNIKVMNTQIEQEIEQNKSLPERFNWQRLIKIYMSHLLDTQNSNMQTEQYKYKSPSTLINWQVSPGTIRFQQQYSYLSPGSDSHPPRTVQALLDYLIDTADIDNSLQLTQASGLPENVLNALSTEKNFRVLTDLIVRQGGRDNIDPMLNINPLLDDATPQLLYKHLSPIRLPNTALLSIKKPQFLSGGDQLIGSFSHQLIWPVLSESYDVNEKISAKIDTSTMNNVDYLIKPAGKAPVENSSDNHSHYYFWYLIPPANHYQNIKLYVQQDNYDASEIALSDFGLNNQQVFNIQDTLLSMRDGLIYRLSDSDSLTLVGVRKIWLEQQINWPIALQHYVRTLQERLHGVSALPAGQKKAIKVEANLTLFGLLMGEEGKPLHAWYQCDGEQFVLCQSSHWQKLRYLGIAHEVNGQQGAWLSAENTAGKKTLGYIPTLEPDQLAAIFSGNLLAHKALIPHLIVQSMGNVLAEKDKFLTYIIPQDNGDIKAITEGGLIFYIRKQANGFDTLLLSATDNFIDGYHQNEILDITKLKQDLSTLCHYYSVPEVIPMNCRNQHRGWYHPASQKLFIIHDADRLYRYLGFNKWDRSAWFIRAASRFSSQLLLKIYDNGGRITFPDQSPNYQRLDNLLVLKADHVLRLTEQAHVEIDVPALLVIMTDDQQHMSFTFNPTLFHYTVIYICNITTNNQKKIYCQFPDSTDFSKVLITREQNDLRMFVDDKLLVVVGVFIDSEDDEMARKVQFIFHNQYTTAKKLAAYYSEKTGGAEMFDSDQTDNILLPVTDSLLQTVAD